MDRLVYLIAQQAINIPPIHISGKTTGNTIRLEFSPPIEIKDYICSIQPTGFQINNIEFNITTSNNIITFLNQSTEITETITIPPGMYEFAQIASIVSDVSGNIITLTLNNNTGSIDITVESGYIIRINFIDKSKFWNVYGIHFQSISNNRSFINI
jgi:hypothetical protein